MFMILEHSKRRMMKCLFCLLLMAMFTDSLSAMETEKVFLSGKDRLTTVDWQFKVSGGRKCCEWTTIPVPSNWEMQGFGTHRYYSDWTEEPAADKTASYKTNFLVPADWQGMDVDIVFGGVMTDTEVEINGQRVGEIHQGGFYQFKYNISEFLQYGKKNDLQIEVSRFSENRSVNLAERRADYWMFSGIYRPVWLEIKPKEHIEQVSLNANHLGDLHAVVALDGINSANSVSAQLYSMNGKKIGRKFSAKISDNLDQVILDKQFKNIEPWSAEDPVRYRLEILLKSRSKVIHKVEEVIGFRTIDLRPSDGLYVNNKKVTLKGVNRHSFWPDSGRTTSEAISRLDVELIKSMNMNAVRVAHAPPDQHFLAMTDELGLYVINELGGWQDAYDEGVGRKLVTEMIARDHNHPSIIMWANGNEGGWNPKLDSDFKTLDIQKRPVIHPWAVFGGIDASHYETVDCCISTLFGGEELFMPTEFLHGLYDGGAGAGLDDWWKKMEAHPLSVGGFIWAFADEGIVRADRNGQIDAAGNSAPDGILGPYREKEGSYYAIREIWSPVYFPLSERTTLPDTFNGVFNVRNRYDFTNLSEVSLKWELRQYPIRGGVTGPSDVTFSGHTAIGDIAPGLSGTVRLDLPKGWQTNDVLALSAYNPSGKLIHTWSWTLSGNKQFAYKFQSGVQEPATLEESDATFEFKNGDLSVVIDKKTGQLLNVSKGKSRSSLANGPILIGGEGTLKSVEVLDQNHLPSVKFSYSGELRKIQWQLKENGWLQLNYAYSLPPSTQVENLGISFDYPESKVKGVSWIGRGPYRVWKNRLKGMTHGYWKSIANDTVTGQSWDYPEFKGFFKDVSWASFETDELNMSFLIPDQRTYLRVFTPTEASNPMKTSVNFPAGNISFMQAIPPIGSKFHEAKEHGLQGYPSVSRRLGQWYEGSLFIRFGD